MNKETTGNRILDVIEFAGNWIMDAIGLLFQLYILFIVFWGLLSVSPMAALVLVLCCVAYFFTNEKETGA
jgi:hypothetical protein